MITTINPIETFLEKSLSPAPQRNLTLAFESTECFASVFLVTTEINVSMLLGVSLEGLKRKAGSQFSGFSWLVGGIINSGHVVQLRIFFPSRPFAYRIRHRNALTEKAWEDVVHNRHRTVKGMDLVRLLFNYQVS